MANALIVHPTDPAWAPTNHGAFIKLLAGLKLLALPQQPSGDRYPMGDDFAQLISFIGCSPTLFQQSSENKSAPLFDLLVPPAAETPRWLCGPDAPAPRCPTCRQPGANLDAALAGNWTCAKCNTSHPARDWRWPSRSGLARAHISICGIVEGTALPSDRLLSGLLQATSVSWRHCYCR